MDDNEIYFPLENGVTWINHQDTGVNLTNPTVIKDNGIYKMWTYPDPAADKFYYQESADGVNWSSEDAVLTLADLTALTVADSRMMHPWVIKDGSLYKMWFSAESTGPINDIGYCESGDGKNWTNCQKVIVGTVPILGIGTPNYTTPCVIKVDGKYKIWFIGEIYTDADIIYGESPDGINWKNFTWSIKRNTLGIYDQKSALKPCVIRDSTVYKIWYAGNNSIGSACTIYAESNNGVSWEKTKLVMPYPRSSPAVINDGGIGRMWYYYLGTGTIWYAESR